MLLCVSYDACLALPGASPRPPPVRTAAGRKGVENGLAAPARATSSKCWCGTPPTDAGWAERRRRGEGGLPPVLPRQPVAVSRRSPSPPAASPTSPRRASCADWGACAHPPLHAQPAARCRGLEVGPRCARWRRATASSSWVATGSACLPPAGWRPDWPCTAAELTPARARAQVQRHARVYPQAGGGAERHQADGERGGGGCTPLPLPGAGGREPGQALRGGGAELLGERAGGVHRGGGGGAAGRPGPGLGHPGAQ